MNRRDFLKRTGGIALLLGAPNLQANLPKKSNLPKALRSKKAYLTPLSIGEGMFSSENTIVLKTYDGTETSGFISNDKIKDGRLEVSIVKEKGELALINLPCRMSEDIGSDGYLTVKKQVLEYA